MAKLYVTEYAALGQGANGIPAQIAYEPPVASQVVTFTTSTQSSAFNAATQFVRVHTDSICSITFGTNPTATTSNRRMAADATEYFAVPAGNAFKVAAVTNT
jgi:hypothetical protein